MTLDLFSINLHNGQYEMVFEKRNAIVTVTASVAMTHSIGRKILETILTDFPPEKPE